MDHFALPVFVFVGLLCLGNTLASPLSCVLADAGFLNVSQDMDNLSVYEGWVQPQNCVSFSIDVDRYCSLPGSFLLIEFWSTEWQLGNEEPTPISPLTITPDIFFGTAFNKPPFFWTEDRIIHVQPQASRNPWQEKNLDMSYLDNFAVLSYKPAHSVLLPTGNMAAVADKKLTLNVMIMNLNLADSPHSRALGYSLRATCAPSMDEVPCPRPTPDLGPCGKSNPTVNTTRGECFQLEGRPSVCLCQDGWGERSCSAPVVNITESSARWDMMDLPPQTWRYYLFTVPAKDAYFLTELVKPALSFSHYQPMLVLRPMTNHEKTLRYALPAFLNIPDIMFEVNTSCLCEDCDCFFPYQSDNIDYQLQHLRPESDSYSWYVGIFNNAPFTNQAPVYDDADMLSFRYRYSVGEPAAPLCPMDCSGRGRCEEPTPYLASPMYFCNCSEGYGGPFCEGSEELMEIKSSDAYEVNRTIAQGRWNFYEVKIDQDHFNNGALTFGMRSATGDKEEDVPLLTIFSPLWPGDSVGDLYFAPASSVVMNSSHEFKVPSISSHIHGILDTWVVGIYNPNIITAQTVGYVFAVTVEKAPHGSKTLSTLQLALIVALSVTLAVLTTHIVVRILMIRRITRRESVEAILAAAARGAEGQALRQATTGVPQEIIATFLVFNYAPLRKEEDGFVSGKQTGAVQNKGVKAAKKEEDGRGGGKQAGAQQGRELNASMKTLSSDLDIKLTPGKRTSVSEPSLDRILSSALSGSSIRLGSMRLAEREANQLAAATAAADAGSAPKDRLSSISRQTHDQNEERTYKQEQSPTERSSIVRSSAQLGGIELASFGGVETGASFGGPCAAGEHEDEDIEGPQCTICLIEYEEGDPIRQLPCKHMFHKLCIDVWMQRRSTCPMCRTSLLPESEGELPRVAQQDSRVEARTRAPELELAPGAPEAVGLRPGTWIYFNNPVSEIPEDRPSAQSTNVGFVIHEIPIPALRATPGAGDQEENHTGSGGISSRSIEEGGHAEVGVASSKSVEEEGHREAGGASAITDEEEEHRGADSASSKSVEEEEHREAGGASAISVKEEEHRHT